MAATQLVVRRTFLEVDGHDLKDRVLEMRRGRCMSEPAQEKEFDVRSTATTAVWSDASDCESDCGGSAASSTARPAGPPGVFVEAAQRARATTVARGAAPAESRTTVLFRNVLPSSTRSDLCTLLDAQGFRAQYNFLYVPANFKTMLSFGYAFVNFVNGHVADAARRHFDGFQCVVRSESSVLETSWSSPHQGYEVQLERYRDSPVMHSSVADEYKPILLRGGVRVAFPAPTKRLAAPGGVRRGSGRA